MRHELIVTALALALALCLAAAPCASADQSITLGAGFNFVGILVKTADTSRTLLDATPAATQVFAFDPATQAFQYQLRLPGGAGIFGSPLPFTPLRGYVVRCGEPAAFAVASTEEPATLDPLPALVVGFNFVPLPLRAGTGAKALLALDPTLASVFRWNAALAVFEFVLRLPNGQTFGADFDLGPASVAYFLKRTGAAGAPATLTLTPSTATAPAGGSVDLAGIFAVAGMSDGATREVTTEVAWTISSGDGSLAGATYVAPALAGGTVLLRATYSAGGASVTADLTLHVVPAVALELALSTGEITLAPSGSFDLASVGAWLAYDNGATAGVAVAWSLVAAGGGSLSGSVYNAGAAPGEATLRASRQEPGGENYTVDLRVVIAVDPVATAAENLGEPVDGFPSAPERTMFLYMNACRIDPAGYKAAFMTSYSMTGLLQLPAVAPFRHGVELSRAARDFAAAEGNASFSDLVKNYYSGSYSNYYYAYSSGGVLDLLNWLIYSDGQSDAAAGFRGLLMNGALRKLGVGRSGIWAAMAFSSDAPASFPPLVVGSHDFFGSETRFMLLHHDAQGRAPRSAAVVVAGTAYPLARTLGTDGSGMFSVARTTSPSPADYYFALVDADGKRWRYPGPGVFRTEPFDAATTYVAPALDALALSRTTLSLQPGGAFDLAAVATTALYANGTAKAVAATWSVAAGGGSFAGPVYTAPAATGSATLRATYAEGGVTRTADLAVTVPALATLALSPAAVTGPAGSDLALRSAVRATATYADGMARDASADVAWTLKSGGGSVANAVYALPAAAGSSVATATLAEAGASRSADLAVSVTAATGASVSFVAPVANVLSRTLAGFAPGEEAVIALWSTRDEDQAFAYSLEGIAAAGAPRIAAAPLRAAAGSGTRHPNWRADADRYEEYARLAAEPGALAALRAPRPRRAPAPPSRAGTILPFWIVDANGQYKQVSAECKRVSAKAYFFEDLQTRVPFTKFPADKWAAFGDAFDAQIHPRVTAAFGREPNPEQTAADVDGDGKIYILFSPEVNLAGMGGYFSSNNEHLQSQVDAWGWTGVKSNEKEILYMHEPEGAYDAWFEYTTLGTLAHEFQHMVSYNQHVRLSPAGSAPFEEAWLEEGMSQVAEDVAGYGSSDGNLLYSAKAFLEAPGDYSLTHWFFDNGSYGMSYLFARYLCDHGVAPATLLQSGKVGKANVEAATGKPFAETFRAWVAALWLADTGRTTDAAYGFTFVKLRGETPDRTMLAGPAPTAEKGSPAFASASGTVKSWGVNFVRVTGGTGADALLRATDPGSSGLGASVIRSRP